MSVKKVKTAVETTSKKYADNLYKNQEQVQEENKQYLTETAKNELESGILSVKKNVLDKQKSLRDSQNRVKSAEKALEDAKYDPNFNSQRLVNKYTELKQSQADQESAQAEFDSLQELLTYLQSVESELF